MKKLNHCENCKYFKEVYIRNENNRYVKLSDGKGICTHPRNEGMKGKDWEACMYYIDKCAGIMQSEGMTQEELKCLRVLLDKYTSLGYAKITA